MDEWPQFFQPYKIERNGDGNLHAVEAAKGEAGFFTSYEHDGKFISYYGDNHPKYAGNVVKAMASAKHGYKHVVELFQGTTNFSLSNGAATNLSLSSVFDNLVSTLDEQLRAYVVRVERLT